MTMDSVDEVEMVEDVMKLLLLLRNRDRKMQDTASEEKDDSWLYKQAGSTDRSG